MKRRTAALAVGAFVLLGAGIVGSVAVLRSTSTGQAAPAACDRAVPLVARTRDGLPWQQHRRWLEATDADPLPGQSHLLRNDRTGEWFRWARTAGVDGRPRFMVPTRYAALVNRRWQEDPWTYCLVAGPQPPFELHAGGFTTRARAHPATVEAGAAVVISAEVTAQIAATVIIEVELRDGQGRVVARWVFADEMLRKGEATPYTVLWTAPPGSKPGIYVIQVGVFSKGWGMLRHWNDGTGVLVVRGPAAQAGP